MKPTRVEAAGHGLVAALALAILLGAGGLLAHGELETRFRTRAQARSIAALSQAREALLGYAISYDESHSGQGQGYLPCPDTDNTGSTALGACGPRGAADRRDGPVGGLAPRAALRARRPTPGRRPARRPRPGRDPRFPVRAATGRPGCFHAR